MARRYFNWTLAIVLVVAVVVFAGAVFSLHRWQRSTRAERTLPRGEQAYAEGKWDEAADQLGLYLGIRSDDVPVLLKYADAQWKRRPLTGGHIQQAIGAYQSILRLEGSNPDAAKRLVEIYLWKGIARPSEAAEIALEYKGSSDLRRMLALALAQQRKYPEAEKTLLDLIKDHPDDVLAYEVLGRLAQEPLAEVSVPAADWFDKAVTANPQSATAYIIRGAFHLWQGHRDQALVDFEQAAKCDLSDVDVRLRLAQELIRANAIDKAKEHLTAVQAKAPKEPALWQTWAAAMLSAGTAQEKATIAEAGLKELAVYPWDFMPMAAELFAAANQPDKAKDCIDKMRQRGFQPGPMAFLDGLAAGAKGNLWAAVRWWQEAVRQEYTEHASAGGLGTRRPVRMMLASTLEQLNDPQSATIQLQTLISESSTYQDPQFVLLNGRLMLARLMSRRRDWAGALEQAREIQRLVRGSSEAVSSEAVLLELQASIFLLDPAEWQGIEKQLAEVDKAMSGAVQVKLLWAQALGRQRKFAEAAKLLEEAKSKAPSDIRPILLQADLLAGQNKSEEAAALLRSAIKEFPQEIEPVQSLALVLNRQNDSQQCESIIKEAIARMQSPESRRNLGLFLAELYRRWTKEEDLSEWLTDMAGQFPKDIQVKRGLLTCPAVAKNVQQAQTLVDQIKLLEGPDGWQWRYEQAKVWLNSAVTADPNVFRARHYTQTTALLQDNLLANPNDQASRLLLAAAHERAGQQQLALSAYREALSRAPNDIVIIMQTVAALYRSGGAAEAKEAEKLLRGADKRKLYHPDLKNLELYSQRMQWQDQVRRGALDSASDTLQQLVRTDPNDVVASLWLARISMQQGKLDEAEVTLKGLEAKAPQSIPVIQARIQLYVLRGNAQEALRLCNETVQRNDRAVAYLLRARTYASLRENDKAIEDFKQAVDKDPNNAGIRMDRASFYQSLGRRAEAIQDVRKALTLPAGVQPILERAIPLCLVSGSRTLVEEAETSLDKARTADPNNASLKLLKAQLLLNRPTRPSVEQGQRLLQQVTAAQPELPQAWHLLGRLELRQGLPGRALDTALGGLSHNEGDRDLLLLKADAEAARSPAAAVSTLRSLLEPYPNDIEIEMRLASALYQSGNKSAGQAILDARMKAEPNNPAALVTLTHLLAREERWTDVAEQVTNWLARHPDDTLVVATVARSLLAFGNAQALTVAENLLNAAVKRNPKSIAAMGSLAMLMQSTGRTAEAAVLNRKVLELDPNDVIALNNLAWVLCEEDKQYREALELAERGLKVTPDYADLLDTRGVALYRRGLFEKAAEDFTRCIELYPVDASPLASVHCHLARAYAKMGRTVEARQSAKQAMDLHNRATEPAKRLSPEDLADAKLLLEQLP